MLEEILLQLSRNWGMEVLPLSERTMRLFTQHIALILPNYIHLLPTEGSPAHKTVAPSRKGLRLSDLSSGETGRVLRLTFADAGCRKRFAEMGLAEGMKVTVSTAGETMMLVVGGSRMGMGARCADQILVAKV